LARQPRFIVPGQPHLVIQRAHGAHPAFVDTADAKAYLAALAHAMREHDVRLHAYGLVATEVGLLATPSDPQGLSKLMQAVARRYAQHVKQRYQRAGTPWQGRFCSAPVDAATQLLNAMRLIEMPIAGTPLAVIASSEAHHAGAGRDALVADHPAYWSLGNTPFEREATYRAFAAQPLADTMARNMRASVINGWPIGSAAYLDTLAREADRPSTPAPRGRPGRT